MNLKLVKKQKHPSVPIIPRRMGFSFAGVKHDDYWFDNDPVLTHLLNILSLTFLTASASSWILFAPCAIR